jgi:hypothetical protein
MKNDETPKMEMTSYRVAPLKKKKTLNTAKNSTKKNDEAYCDVQHMQETDFSSAGNAELTKSRCISDA